MSWGRFFFESHVEAFCLRVMPKLDHLDVFFSKNTYGVSKRFDVVSRLLLVTPHSHIGVDTITHLCIVVQKKPAPLLSLLSVTQAGLE